MKEDTCCGNQQKYKRNGYFRYEEKEYFGLSDMLMFGLKLPRENSKARCHLCQAWPGALEKDPEAEVYHRSGRKDDVPDLRLLYARRHRPKLWLAPFFTLFTFSKIV